MKRFISEFWKEQRSKDLRLGHSDQIQSTNLRFATARNPELRRGTFCWGEAQVSLLKNYAYIISNAQEKSIAQKLDFITFFSVFERV